MPKVKRDKLYKAIIDAAREQYADPRKLDPYRVTRPEGTPLYRYVDYRNSEPQVEKAGRTIWTDLEYDTSNRWTGRGPGESVEGQQGVYLSGEYLDINKPFPELEHYINKDVNPNDPVFYYRYEKGVAPKLVLGTVGELRSMFLFSTNKELQGIDLRISAPGEHQLLQDIFINARKEVPEAFLDSDSLESLYYAGEDASFCRAVGNATLEKTGADFFQTTSVRDKVSVNVIMGGQTKTPIPTLKPEGRASFFLNLEGGIEGVFTVLDLKYNAAFEQTGLGVLPPRSEIEANLKSIASDMTDTLIKRYQEALTIGAPTDNLVEIGDRLSGLKTLLDNNNIGDAISDIEKIKSRITELRTSGQVEGVEINSFKTVDYVMKSLQSITESINVAKSEPVQDPEEISGEVKDIEYTDPTEAQVDPHIAE